LCLVISLFFSSIAFAVVADANMIEQVRQMKVARLAELKTEYDEIPQQIRRCRFAPIVADRKDTSYNKPASNRKRQTGRRPAKITFKSQKEKLEALNELKKKPAKIQQNISALEANDINCLFPVFTLPFSVGQIGRLGKIILRYYEGIPYVHNQYLKIISISDNENALVRFYITERFQDSPSPRESQTLIGYRVGRYVPVTKTIWLRGFDLEDRITGSSLTPKGPWIITGTTDYMTPNHAKFTVYVFEPLEIGGL